TARAATSPSTPSARLQLAPPRPPPWGAPTASVSLGDAMDNPPLPGLPAIVLPFVATDQVVRPSATRPCRRASDLPVECLAPIRPSRARSLMGRPEPGHQDAAVVDAVSERLGARPVERAPVRQPIRPTLQASQPPVRFREERADPRPMSHL